MSLEMIEPVIARLDVRADLGPSDARKAMASGKMDEWAETVQQTARQVADAIRDEACPVVATLLREYATGGDVLRDAIRHLLARYRRFAWLAGTFVVQPEQSATESLRAELLWISMNDRWTDSRDNSVSIDALCAHARKIGLDIAPLLEEVAALSRSELDILRLSTCKSLRDARARLAKGP